MTTIDLNVTGTRISARVNGCLTGGLTGVRVSICYDQSWDGLVKTLVCRSAVDGLNCDEVRCVLNIGTEATVAHEVMITGRTLFLGIEGRNTDGTEVYPTIWADCGKIQAGANADADPTVTATPEAWEQIMCLMGSLSDLDTEQKGNLVAAINEAMKKGGGIPGADGRGIVSIEGNEDGSWTVFFDDDTSEQISNQAYLHVVALLRQAMISIAQKTQILPEFVDSISECTDTGKLYVLPDGYLYAYLLNSNISLFTNQLVYAINTEGETYNEGMGYKTGWRFNSSNQEVEADGQLITGYIPYTPGQVIRISGYITSDTPNGYIQIYKANYNLGISFQAQQLYGTDAGFSYAEDPSAPGVYVLTINPAAVTNGNIVPHLKSADTAFIRVNISGYNEAALKVTLDEEIVHGTSDGWTNTGYTFIQANYEDRIVALEEQVESLKNGSTVVPEYVAAEAESVLERVIAAQGSRTFTFAAITDMHYGEGDYTAGVVHACKAMKYIDERIKLDAVAVLGDYTNGWPAENYEDALGDFQAINNVLDDLRFAPNLRLAGNHDIYNENPALTMRYINAYSDDVVWGSRAGGYYYRDFGGYKVRVIGLNTCMLSAEQYNWFATALDLSDKEDISQWSILILSHHPLDWMEWIPVNPEDYCFCYILDGYKKGQSGVVSGTFGGTSGEVHYDFTNGKNAAKLIGNIHGHLHNFKVDYIHMGSVLSNNKSDVIRIATPNSCYNRENGYEGVWADDVVYPKEKNAATDTSFCVYCIDLDACTIKAICYGAGPEDHVIDYSYTNEVLPSEKKVMDTEVWTFELEDGSTVTKQMVVMV